MQKQEVPKLDPRNLALLTRLDLRIARQMIRRARRIWRAERISATLFGRRGNCPHMHGARIISTRMRSMEIPKSRIVLDNKNPAHSLRLANAAAKAVAFEPRAPRRM